MPVNEYKDFYVYEWFNTDTDEVFYVGKGRKNRYKNTIQRNNYFKNYYNKYNCAVRKVKTDIEENEAFELEKETIEKYRDINQCKCNLLDGGKGGSSNGNITFTLLRELQSSVYCKKDHSELREMTFEELIEEDKEKEVNKDSARFLNLLDIYDDNGDLNIGWECFED